MASRFGFRDLLNRRQLILAGVALAAIVLTGWAAFEIALAGAIGHAGQQSDRRLALFDRTLEAIIERFHYLPSSIALAEEARAVLANPADPDRREAANGFLSKLNETAGAGELFIMAPDGAVVAASNWWAYDSFVGENLSYRPYFEEAMADGDAKFYAVGTVTGVAGYFLARRIDGPDGPLGVAVTKINLGEIEANWWRSGELIVIVDLNNVTILSTRPDWRYRPLATLDPGAVSRIADQRRYGAAGLIAAPVATAVWPSRGTQFALLTGEDSETSGYFILDELRLPTHQWRIVAFTPTGPLFRAAWTAAAAAALAAAASLLIVLLLVQRRRIVAQRLAEHDRLELRVAERTEDLHIANEALREEIADRIRAEKAERAAQHGLVQAAKLASLGQALAGVAHEVSQPIAALRMQTASAKLLARGKGPELLDLLGAMEGVLGRLTALTGHLKTFARRETEISIRSDVVHIVHNAVELAGHLTEAGQIVIALEAPDTPLLVIGNPVHIEQVLINLISNAADAMEGVDHPLLTIAVAQREQSVVLSLSDVGAGIDPAVVETLFDPFVTTKQPGKGLGLGLSISWGLIRDMGGRILVESTPGAGSTFTVVLPLAPSETRLEFEPA